MTTPALNVESSPGAPQRPGPPSRTPGRIARVGAFAIIGTLFVWLATQFDPVQSSAQFRAGAGPGERAPAAKPQRGKLLGSLVGGPYTVRIHASARGPLYSVWDTRTGRALAEDLWADEVYRDFPDLDPRALHAGPDGGADADELLGPLMTAEQHNEPP